MINSKFHHIAIIVNSIENKLSWYCEVYNAVPIGTKIFIDNDQKVKVQFINCDNNFKIELLEPLNETSPVKSYLKKYGSGSLYHMAYEVNNLDETEIAIKEKGGLVISRSRNGWNRINTSFYKFVT